jgi:hypothetical protein
MKPKLLMLFGLCISIAFSMSSCGTVPKRNPVPEQYGDTAEIPGIPRAGFWYDKPPSFSQWRALR